VIISLTPNPSVDRTIEVDELVRGAVLRAQAARVDPGGKGVNVARALVANGVEARAVLPLGGAEGRQLADLLDGEGIDVVRVPIAGAVRANVSIVEPDGTVTKINEPGPVLSAAELDALVAATVAAAAGADWVAVSGSLPPGAPTDLYARLVTRLHAVGVRVAVDGSGPPLARALAAGPDLVKPNAEELAEASGMVIVTLGDAITAAAELRRRGASAVLASLGPDGALLVDGDRTLHGEALVVERHSTVGAGDAALAGVLGALRARSVAAACDFLSLGTNDLAQYAFGADRTVGGSPTSSTPGSRPFSNWCGSPTRLHTPPASPSGSAARRRATRGWPSC
jgi:1-phosphofructokinase